MSTSLETIRQAWQLLQIGQVDQAVQVARDCLAANANDALAYELLGVAHLDRSQMEPAIGYLQRSIALAPQLASPLNNLGNAYYRLDRLDEAIVCYERALAIEPNSLSFLKNKGVALYASGRFAEALEANERALQIAPGDAEIHKHVGILRLSLGDFAGGWPEYEWRWKAGDKLPSLDRPLWNGEALFGKTILLVAEQGFGDMIQFVRYAAWLKRRYGCRVLLFCPQLRRLLEKCEGIDGWVEQPDSQRLPPYDVFCPLIRVPAVLAHTTRDFPSAVSYLTAEPAIVEAWRTKLATFRGLKVGIHWRGRWREGEQFRLDPLRSIPLAAFERLAKLPGVQLFSLQKGEGAAEVSGCDWLVDLGSQLDETTGPFVETAAVLKNLDLLITCDTAIAHLCGALGVPVWVALCNVPDWRWGISGEATGWYPSMRLFRQTKSREWTDVFERMVQAIKKGDG